MNNQVVAYDRLSGKVKIIDGAVTIPISKAKHKGFTPENLSQIACQLLQDSKDSHSQRAMQLAKQAIHECQLAKQTKQH